MALGQGTVILTGGLDLSVHWTIGLCGILLACMVKGSDAPLLYALPTVLLLACLIGLVNGLGIVFLGLSPIVMTLATNGLLQGAALLYSNGTPDGFSSPMLRWFMTGRIWMFTPVVWFMVAFVIFAVSSFWRAGFTPDASYASLALPQLLQGAGIAMYFAPLIAISLGGLPPERMAFGSGLVNFFRTNAGSFGASPAITLWERREAVHHTRLAEAVTAYAPQAVDALARLGDTGLTHAQALGRANAALVQQSTLLAANDVFWLSGWLFVLLVASVWLAGRPSRGAPVPLH